MTNQESSKSFLLIFKMVPLSYSFLTIHSNIAEIVCVEYELKNLTLNLNLNGLWSVVTYVTWYVKDWVLLWQCGQIGTIAQQLYVLYMLFGAGVPW